MSRGGRICECGKLKSQCAEACLRCTFLDRPSKAEAVVVSAMRALGDGVTIYDLSRYLGLTERQVWRSVGALYKSGRVQKHPPEEVCDVGVYHLTGAV